MTVKITQGKYAGLNACADSRGVIAALAVDHRGNLLDAIAQARGPRGLATAADMLAFKTAVTKVLTPLTSAILLDPEYSLEVIGWRAPTAGVLLAYEKSGYDFRVRGRLPDLLPTWSVQRLVERGAQAIKILMYYNPYDEAWINSVKQAYVERIGAECRGLDVPFFLEPLVYDDAVGNEKSLEFARRKPDYVARSIEEFSKPRYGVDILKVEMPVNPAFIAGTRSFGAEGIAYSRQEAIEHFQRAASAASRPFIYLSAGSTNEVFCEMLELAAEAGVKYAGILCGRATWQDAIPVYAKGGTAALEDWLAGQGQQHIRALNDVLARGAFPWWEVYGGKENIQLV